jgi:molecular chaperone GrpE
VEEVMFVWDRLIGFFTRRPARSEKLQHILEQNDQLTEQVVELEETVADLSKMLRRINKEQIKTSMLWEREQELTQEVLEQSQQQVRRTSHELEEYITKKVETSMVAEFLAVLDQLWDGIHLLKTMEAPTSWCEALISTYERAEEVLLIRGLERIPAEGHLFDPGLHRAIGTVPAGDAPQGMVIEVTRPGYILAGVVIRYAEVVVAKHFAEEDSTESSVLDKNDDEDNTLPRSHLEEESVCE